MPHICVSRFQPVQAQKPIIATTRLKMLKTDYGIVYAFLRVFNITILWLKDFFLQENSYTSSFH